MYHECIFENSKIIAIQRYEKGGPAPDGSIMIAKFELNGSQYACSDSYIKHEWGFTPGVSNFVECRTEDEIENLFSKLSENGNILMPLDNYGFSQKFGFVEDRFGVSVDISGNYAIIGAFQEDEDDAGINTFTDAGSAYVYERDLSGNWIEVQKIVPSASDRGANTLFGSAVAISGTTIGRVIIIT